MTEKSGSRYGECQHDGGMGVGAGHVCFCTRGKGHPIDCDRPHVCLCGAQWRDCCDPAIGHHSTPHIGCALR